MASSAVGGRVGSTGTLAVMIPFAALGACLGLACAAAPAAAPDVPIREGAPPLASMKAFRSIDEAFARLVHYYDGFAPPRSDVMWNDLLDRLRGLGDGRM